MKLSQQVGIVTNVTLCYNAKPRSLIAASTQNSMCLGTGENKTRVVQLFSKVDYFRIIGVYPARTGFCTQPSSSRLVSHQCRVFRSDDKVLGRENAFRSLLVFTCDRQ